MTSLKSVQGSERILTKLKNLTEGEEYYEAHQLYRTIYFRYLNSKRYAELRELLYDGAILFLTKNQYNSGADLAALYLDVISKDSAFGESLHNEEERNIFSEKLGKLLPLIPQNTPERGNYIMIALKLKPDIFPVHSIHNQFALVLWREKNFPEARYHFLQSATKKGGEDCALMLIEYQITSGYPSEVDLFIAQFILQLLCIRKKNNRVQFEGNLKSNPNSFVLNNDTCQSDQHAFANRALQCYAAKHPQIQTNNPPFILPLLNFLWFLLMAIDSGKSATFKTLCDLYGTSLKRDPTYNDYLTRIGQLYFGFQNPSRNTRGNFISQLFQSLMDDDDHEQPTSTQFVDHSGNRNNHPRDTTPSKSDPKHDEDLD